jgi:hypothetical protein
MLGYSHELNTPTAAIYGEKCAQLWKKVRPVMESLALFP